MKSSGHTFVAALKQVLTPLQHCTAAYIGDAAVFTSNSWSRHLQHLEQFLVAIRASGFTFKLKKCKFGLPEVRYVGHIVGSGRRRADPDKIATVQNIKPP